MVSFRRTFPARPEAFSTNHPYTLDTSKQSCQVPFLEFRGTGPPSSTIGYPGDVYVDLTPSAYALYWRDRNGRDPGAWRRWTSLLLDQVPLYKYLVSHPWADDAQRSDLFLWVDPTGISWTSRAEICASRVVMIQKNIGAVQPGERNPDVPALVSQILEKMIDMEDRRTLPPILLERSLTSPPPTRPRSLSSATAATHYSPPAAFISREPRPSSPHSQYPSKRQNTLSTSPTQLPPLASAISPRLSSRATSPPFRASPYERPARSPPHPIIPIPISPRFSDHRPQQQPQEQQQRYIALGPKHNHRETPYRGEYPLPPGTSSGSRSSNNAPRRSESPPSPPTNGHHHPTPPAADHPDSRENFGEGAVFFVGCLIGMAFSHPRIYSAWTEMQRAQYAEAHFKRELRQKNRELSKFKKKEKDIISLSFIYQKKEQELLDALANAEKRSAEELDKQRQGKTVALPRTWRPFKLLQPCKLLRDRSRKQNSRPAMQCVNCGD
ncbi:hypothetical protein HMN09_00826800 [Mycena chlorophos]|uniref:Uncharacterized protein n=1 Tax=Mycena chlorophos TaxID=658473 RepID=A0A8H6SUP3_MYCCL|nr:hypothetical protein HMN09_00826800 [Mycena chlorophos]